MRLTHEQIQTIIEHARSGPDEVCGVLVGRRAPLRIEQILRARNVHPQPQQHFLVDAAALLYADDLAQSTGHEIVGFYHSHPSGAAVPSPYDRRDAWPGYVYIIAACVADLFYICAWTVDEQGRVRPQSLVPRP